MKKRIFFTVVLLVFVLMAMSYFYKIIFIAWACFLWRKQFSKRLKLGLIFVFLISLWWSMPRYRTNSNDRVQLIYQDKNYQPTTPPMYQYLWNTMIPEEEAVQVIVRVGGIVTKYLPINIIKGTMGQQFKNDAKKGRHTNFLKPYNKLRNEGLNPMSQVVSQFFNQYTSFPKTRAVSVIKPKNYDTNKTYPVVVFLHGYLGGAKLYQNFLSELENCVVICVGTTNMSGIFTSKDLKDVFKNQLPFFKKLGYKIDNKNLHLIGLSNGGSGVNVAYKYFNRKFKSLTYISCSPYQTYHIPCKINLVGAIRDNASSKHPYLRNTMRKNGNKVAMYFSKDDNHFILVNQQKEIVEFLNKELK